MRWWMVLVLAAQLGCVAQVAGGTGVVVDHAHVESVHVPISARYVRARGGGAVVGSELLLTADAGGAELRQASLLVGWEISRAAGIRDFGLELDAVLGLGKSLQGSTENGFITGLQVLPTWRIAGADNALEGARTHHLLVDLVLLLQGNAWQTWDADRKEINFEFRAALGVRLYLLSDILAPTSFEEDES